MNSNLQKTSKSTSKLNQSQTLKSTGLTKLRPSQLLQKQISGSVLEDPNHKPKIIQFLNISDYSTYTQSSVDIDEPMFEPIPSIIQFNDYEPLQIKDKIFRLRNRDKCARRVKIIPPDSRLFQVLPYNKNLTNTKDSIKDNTDTGNINSGSKVAPGMEIAFIVRFSPEAKIDYTFDLVVVTEREKFIVPVVATGKRAMIDFPDIIDFEDCPVKYTTEKPIIIKNIGEKTTKWSITLPPGVDANKKEGILENGRHEQIIFKFTPTESKPYKYEAILSYDNLTSYILVQGHAHDGKVYLSNSNIKLKEAYIGLKSQQTIQIVNKSSVMVDFQWRAFSTEKEEIDRKNKLRTELDHEEAEERMLLKETVAHEPLTNEIDIDNQDDSEEDERDEKVILMKKQKKAELAIARKYRNIRKAIDDDPLLFQDDIFSIEPQTGQIWPNSELTVTISFQPQAALDYSCTSYCNISCSEERLPLHLTGEGIGPKAVLSQNDIDIGDVFITSEHQLDFTIENRGEIEAVFDLLPNDTPFGRMFTFDIDKGSLGVGERLNFTVKFKSTILGEFSETFRFRLEGSSELISLNFKGHVIAPTFKVEPDKIDFGFVSYSFSKPVTIKLINTSQVSFRFNLRIPGDGKISQKEFEIKPQRDTISKDEEREIIVLFTPQNVRKYNMVLVVDIENVGQDMLSIPIEAESSVPTVKIKPNTKLDFERVFLRHEYTNSIELINESNLPAKFKVLPQTEESKVLAHYTTDYENGEIPAKQQRKINITLATIQPGNIILPLSILILGSSTLPQVINIVAVSSGPIIEATDKEIDFGNVEVLKDWTRTTRILNKYEIPADIHIFTKNKISIFKPLQKHVILEPQAAIDIQIVCTADDSNKFQDTLHFVVDQGTGVDVILKAKGIGSTIFCKEDLRSVSFGTHYTFRNITREFFIENKGRKSQKLTWNRKRPFESKKAKLEEITEKKDPDLANSIIIEDEGPSLDTFAIFPESILLPAKTGVMFQFRCNATKKGKLSEEFMLTSIMENDKKQQEIFRTIIEGEFINPKLLFSESKLYFKYTWEKDIPPMPITKNLEISCGCPLPVNFQLDVQLPFRINAKSFTLIPGKSAIVKVEFDPSLKFDKISGINSARLQIIHVDHPHREYVDLIGETCFPNLKIEQDKINFGSILKDTTKSIIVNLQNLSIMPICYEWSFLTQFIQKEVQILNNTSNIIPSELTEQGSASPTKTKKNRDVYKANEIFDILPFSGTLNPGETEKVEFIFNALLNQKVKTSAMCTIEGGPQYEVTLVGDSSNMIHRLSTNLLDYGDIPFNDFETKEIIIENASKVAFEFNVDNSKLKRKALIEISPLTGKILGNEKAKLFVKLCPGIPDIIDEYFTITIAHLEPEVITMKGRGIYPSVIVQLPRADGTDNNVVKTDEALSARGINNSTIFANKSVELKNLDPTLIIVPLAETEIEDDRKKFCEYLLNGTFDIATTDNPSPVQSIDLTDLKKLPSKLQEDEILANSFIRIAKNSHTTARHLDPKIFDKIILTYYVLDLGNIVIGGSKKKQFRLVNTSILPISFQFDQRNTKTNGVTVNPERHNKLLPNESVTINVAYQTKKTLRPGKNKLPLIVDVKNGPKYQIDLICNLTTPDITIPNDTIDFQKVLIGQRKTIYLRFENQKEVVCKWSLSTRAEIVTPSDKENNKFSMHPTNGIIQPGQKQMIEFTFVPTGEKTYINKFIIIIEENPRTLVINVKGQGSSIFLEFIPDKISIGPILPYDDSTLCRLDIRNPTEYDTEFYSLNFDSQYLQDDDMLRNYDEFGSNSDQLFFPVRYPGTPFWDKIKKSYNVKMKKNEIDRKLKELPSTPENQELRDKLQKELDTIILMNQDEVEVIYPKKVEDKLKHHIVIYGPPGCGKTQLAQFLSTQHSRGIVNFNEILEWNVNKGTEIGKQAQEYLENRKKELEAILIEREKNAKKKGAKKPGKGEEEPPFIPEAYGYLEENMIIELFKERIDHPEFNAGIIIENLSPIPKYYENELSAMKAILKALPDQTIQLVNLYYPTDNAGLEVSEIIDTLKVNGVYWKQKREAQQQQQQQQQQQPQQPQQPQQQQQQQQGGKGGNNPDKSLGNNKAVTSPRNNNKGQAATNNKGKGKGAENANKASRHSITQELLDQAQKPLFEVHYPKELDPFELEKFKKMSHNLADLILDQYKDPIHGSSSSGHDQSQQQQQHPKEEESKNVKGGDQKKNAKGQNIQVNIPPIIKEDMAVVNEPVKIVIEKKKVIQKDNRIVTELPIIYNIGQMNYSILEFVPSPQFPDPDKEPVPDPIFHQILKRPPQRQKLEQIKNFQIFVPKENFINDYDSNPEFPYDKTQPVDQFVMSGKTRWIIPARKKLTLFVKFYTKIPGQFENILDFEAFFSIKPYKISCIGLCDYPIINSNPVNVFMNRIKSRPLNPPESYVIKKFIFNESVFDFGPLLIGKNAASKQDSSIMSTNSTVLRITNSGKYDADVEFALSSTVITDIPDIKRGIFYLEPERLFLKVDETQEIRVWALPDQPIRFKDEIICTIKTNPIPVIFGIQCDGAKPTIEIDSDTIQFDKLMLKQQLVKQLKLKNICAIPIKWKLNGIEALPSEFGVNITNGILKPTQEALVEIKFTAIKQQKFTQKLILEVEDTEGQNVKQEPININIFAEAFEISIDLQFKNPENMLDFGAVRVGDTKEQTFSIKNIGLYDIKYRFVMKKKVFRENFKIDPSEGIIGPNQDKVISFKFCSKQELKMRTTNSTTDIVLEILEGKSLEIFKKIMINVNINSVFSKYAIAPIKNINFGPLQFNEQKTRTLEIKNEGLFEFNFTLFDYNDEARRNELKQQEALERGVSDQDPNKKDAKGNKKDTKPPAQQQKKDSKKGGNDQFANGLRIGQWVINPPLGTILPDQSATVEITFIGSGSKLFEQKIGIHITARDPDDQPNGILYEVVAESCIPGIDTENYDSIFEEQIVIPSFSAMQTMQESINSNVFAVEEKTFYFGTLVPSKNPDGIIEKFKISNINKIPCNVKFEVKKRSQSINEQFAFEIQPKTAKIPPHEHVYVKVAFRPTIMASYGGTFEVIVENGDQNPKTGKLLFDLRGEGALPTLKIEKPKDWADERTPLLKFPKTRLDKSSILPIMLKNEGQIPATAKFELTPNENFRFLGQNSFTIPSKSYQTFNMEFKPKDIGIKQYSMIIQTLMNPYESPKLAITGEAYQEDITFEQLPNDSEEEISFGDCVINIQKRITFSMKNHTANDIRFNWLTGSDDFVVTPKVGHINARATKPVTIMFESNKTVTYKDHPLICEIKGIIKEKSENWDDNMSTTRMVTKTEYEWLIKKRDEEKKRRDEEEKARRNAKKGGKEVAKQGKDPRKPEEKELPPPNNPDEEANIEISDPIPEPDYTVIDKTEKSLTLKARAVADYVRYEVDAKEIYFKPTLMYTSRIFQLKLKNTSLIQMKYTAKIVSADTGVTDNGYYSVSPKTSIINSQLDEIITIRFSPKEIDDNNSRLILFNIENLDPKQNKLIIEVDGEAERPICHFELPPPSLNTSNNTNKETSQSISTDGKSNTLDFESLGTKIKNTKKFYVVNPTNQGYEFEWKRIEDDNTKGLNAYSAFFRCLTQKGIILSGKKYEMIFEYTPDIIGNHESSWKFEIPTHKIAQKFFIYGTVVEPNVFIDVGKVNFGPLLLGGKNKEIVKLKNLEHIPFHYSFDKDSIKGDNDYGDSLMVNPISGIIQGDNEVNIEIIFSPKIETNYNYNLICNIKQKSRPISLNVKGIGYNLHHSVSLNEQHNIPISNTQDYIIDFNDIFINEKKTRTITIENSGDFNFDFSIKKSQFTYINFTPENSTVKKNEKMQIEITFQASSEYILKPKIHTFTLNIISGPIYQFRLAGSARKPNIELNFYQYDFGPCYVLKQPYPKTIMLEMRNIDNSAMSIETLYEKTPYLDVQLAPGQVILPSKGKENILQIPIVFTPRDIVKYDENVTFDINGLHKINVRILGEGIPFRLELDKIEYSNVDFGIQRVGNDITKTIKINNLGKKAININFNINNQLEELANKCYIWIHPDKEFTIKPKEIIELEIRFNPKTRLHQFKHELNYEIVENHEVHKLLNIIGSCHGIELKLLEDTIGFGSVVINSKLSKRVQVANLGDINAKFNWDTTFCQQFFTINPKQGIIPANEDFLFEIIFHPNVIDNDIRFTKVKCNIEDSDPLFINLLGKCIPPIKETIQEIRFETMVRTITKSKVIIKNPTSQPWKVKSQISTNVDSIKGYFDGKDIIEIPANGQSEYEIIYKPLTMTRNKDTLQTVEEYHEGSLFFPTPDGLAILYNLFGKSLPPGPSQAFDLTIRAKKAHIQVIPIKNWLKITQRFAVTWKIENDDPSIFIKGANTIDITGEATKEYKLNIFALKQGSIKFTVTFKNEQTYEYVYYKLNMNILPSDIISKIEMLSIVRETISKIINIENPLKKAVEFKKENIICDSDNLSFNPSTFTIPQQSEFGLEVVFRPLIVGEKIANLTLKSTELGDYLYQFVLKGSQSTTQRQMHFKAALGSDLVQNFKFPHYLKKATQYTCRVEKLGGAKGLSSSNPKDSSKSSAAIAASPGLVDFTVETPTFNAPPAESNEGTEIGVNIRYEPSNLGDSRALLVLNSQEGGEYQCFLIGQSTAPVPKGPFKIGAKSAPIEFKNPFFDACEFTIRIDNLSFTTTVKSPIKIEGRKTTNIPIVYKAVPGTTNNGRLTITAGENPPFIFYLQGE